MYYPNQYSSLSKPEALQGRAARSPAMASIGSNSPVSGLQFLSPNQITSNAHLLAFVKENNATLNFPQKLMLMLSYVDNEKDMGNFITCISWVKDGHAFIIKDRKELVDNLLPLFFREGKFSSFTRKLYRWGFRQICIPKGGNKKDRDLLFGHEHFQREKKALMTEMRSVTAAGTRRAIVAMTKKKGARKNKEKDVTKKSSPALVSSPVVHNPENMNLDRVSPVSEAKPQSLVQVHLERLLGGPNTAAKSVSSEAQKPFQTSSSLGENPSTQNALDSLLNARVNPTRDTKKDDLDDLLQMHLQRLLGVPNTAVESVSTKAQTPFQTSSSLGQNSTQTSGCDALLKAKSHSLMPPPVQNKFLGLNDTNALQNHVNYLKAMSQSVAAPSPAPGSAVQPSFCFDTGARLQALRQMGATKQVGSQTVRDAGRGRTSQLSSLSQGGALPSANSSLPKSYLDLIQGNSGGLVGPPAASVPTTVKRVPNLILPETSAPAPRY